MFQRSEENPVLIPLVKNYWEAEAAFNASPVVLGDRFHFLYRAISPPQLINGVTLEVSTIGYAMSLDGLHFSNRRQFIKPEYDWERFGCEDPRVTKMGGKFYIFYTALSTCPFCAAGIKVGLAITEDFRKIEAKYPVTPFNAKAMALFPGKIGGKLAAVLTANTDIPPAKIGLAFFDREDQIWDHQYWESWYSFLDDHVIPLQRSAADHIEVGAPPIRTPYGWLLIYSYIRNYLSPPSVFGIEGVLLDLENPSRILARTDKPWLIPEESYEKYGRVPNVIFPSGAFVRRGKLYLYYGVTDTACSVATASLKSVVEDMLLKSTETVKLERFPQNPVIKPDPRHPWEAKAVFNPGALYEAGKVHLVYRAMSEDNTSVLGYAASEDGFTFNERLSEPIYVPREDFEQKLVPGGNTGCEDPRLTRLDENIFMCYTAFNGRSEPRVALTSISANDFLTKRWNWAKPVLISPPGFMDKDAALFPRKIKGKFAFLHRIGSSIWLDLKDSLGFTDGQWLKGAVILSSRNELPPTEKIGISSTPIETEWGWLLLYHAVSKDENGSAKRYYYVKAALLDANDPSRVIARGKTALLKPEMPYEKEGQIPDVVFPCGAVVINDRLFVYYGGADTVIGVATVKLTELVQALLVST